MTPKINPRGQSFKGVIAYLVHGKIGEENPERVAWTITGNLPTNDVEKAGKVMAWTALHAEEIKCANGGSLAGVKSEGKPVYHQSLSWAKSDNPSDEHMKETALDYIKARGLSEHQYTVVAHDDTEHKHLHIVINLVHPDTGLTSKLGLDKRAAQAWALEYEREHGIHCKLREENAAKREQGEHVNQPHKNTHSKKQDYTKEITRAYYAADNGKTFINALAAEELELVAGRKNNFAIIDKRGDITPLSRSLDIEERGKYKTAAMNNLLKDITLSDLKNGDERAKEIKAELSITQDQSAGQAEDQEQKKQDYVNEQEAEKPPEIFDRDQQEIDQQNALETAALVYAEEQEKNKLEERAKIKAEREKKEFLDIARGQQKKPDTRPNIAPQSEKQNAEQERLKKQNGDWLEGLNKIYLEAKDGLEFRRRIQTELGLTLALGNHKQLVIVDAQPRINSLVKNIEGQNTQQINTRLGNVNADTLQDADKIKKFINQERFSARNHAQAGLINQYRDYWDIDYLQGQINARENNINDFSTLQKVTRRKDIKRMGEEITAYQKSLRHAKVRLSHDINAVYDKAPDFVRREQLKKHGVLEQGAGKYIDKPRQLEADKDLKAVQYQKMKISVMGGLVENHGIQERAQAEELRVQAQREQKKALVLEKLKEVEQVRIETERTRRFSIAAEKVQNKKLGTEFEKTAEEERRKPVTLDKTKAQEQPEITLEQAAMLDSDREKLTPEFQAQQPAKKEPDTPEATGWKNADPEFLEEVKERRKMFEKDQDQEPERGQGYD